MSRFILRRLLLAIPTLFAEPSTNPRCW
jgi:ABC-type microcin C transport system permease subunit YejB